MKCFLHLTLKRDLLNVVCISIGKEFQILAPMLWKDFIPCEPTLSINTVSGVIEVGYIYSFKNLKILRSLFINAVKYMACGQIFYSVFNAHPLNLIKVVGYQVWSL